MRLVFYQPLNVRIGHDLKELIRLKSRSAYRKYHYFISQFFNNKNRDVAIFLDCSNKNLVISYLKCLIWMIINGINFAKIGVLNRVSQLNPQKDVLFSFPFLNLHQPNFFRAESVFRTFKGTKVFHFSHYFYETEKASSFFQSLDNILIVAEANLQTNLLYRKYMGSQFCQVVPFVLRKRYQNRSDFFLRKPKCLACGTKSKIDPNIHAEFYQLFHSNYLHPLRAELHEKKHELEPWIESLIFDYYELNECNPKSKWEQFILTLRKKIGNERKRFFSFDIVQKYNEYQMFVSPEEESGAPSISFVEGMACGCCYFGRPEIYVGLGMIPEVHFVPYDGTLQDLTKKIAHYQQHPDLIAEIARNGQYFVESHFKEKKVAEDFWNLLEKHSRSLCE